MSDDQNMLLLRSDLRHLFDTRRISMVPKQGDIDISRPPQLLVQVLEPGISAQLVPLYQNRCLSGLLGLFLQTSGSRLYHGPACSIFFYATKSQIWSKRGFVPVGTSLRSPKYSTLQSGLKAGVWAPKRGNTRILSSECRA